MGRHVEGLEGGHVRVVAEGVQVVEGAAQALGHGGVGAGVEVTAVAQVGRVEAAVQAALDLVAERARDGLGQRGVDRRRVERAVHGRLEAGDRRAALLREAIALLGLLEQPALGGLGQARGEEGLAGVGDVALHVGGLDGAVARRGDLGQGDIPAFEALGGDRLLDGLLVVGVEGLQQVVAGGNEPVGGGGHGALQDRSRRIEGLKGRANDEDRMHIRRNGSTGVTPLGFNVTPLPHSERAEPLGPARLVHCRPCPRKGQDVVPAFPMLVEVGLEHACPVRVTQLAQRLLLDLAHALAGEAEDLADLLERVGALAVVQAEPQPPGCAASRAVRHCSKSSRSFCKQLIQGCLLPTDPRGVGVLDEMAQLGVASPRPRASRG